MKMKGQIMLRLEVPFEYEIDTLEVKTHRVDSREVLVDPQAHEKLSDVVEEQRINASKYAESELVEALKASLPDDIKVLETVVEEVSEV
jgi:hypothetical protein